MLPNLWRVIPVYMPATGHSGLTLHFLDPTSGPHRTVVGLIDLGRSPCTSNPESHAR